MLADADQSLVCSCLRRGKPELGYELFTSEDMKWPGFVEFDDLNRKALTFSAASKYAGSLWY